MKIQTFAILSALFLVAAPLAVAEEHGEDQGPPEESTWGLCQAQEASQPGDEASNGTVNETPPFQDLSEEDCENAERPGNDTAPAGPPEDVPGPEDHPDEEDNPGDEQEPDHPDEDDNAGDEQEPDHSGSDEGDDRRP